MTTQTTASLFALIRDRLEIMQVVSKDGKPRTEALEALAEIEKRMNLMASLPEILLDESEKIS